MNHKLTLLLICLIAVYLVPLASASTITTNISPIAGQTVTYTFTDNNWVLNLTDATYNWYWADGTTNTTTSTPSATHSYAYSGSYTIIVVVYANLNIDGWEVSEDWAPYYAGSYSETVTVAPNSIQQQTTGIFNTAFSAISLIGITLIVSVAALIISAVRKPDDSEGTSEQIIAGIVLIIGVFILLIIATVVLGGLQVAVGY